MVTPSGTAIKIRAVAVAAAAVAGGDVEAFEVRLLALRDRHRRLAVADAMLDKAKLAPVPPS